MLTQPLFSPRGMAGLLLILSTVLMLVGVILWVGRNMWMWPAGQRVGYLLWERGFLLAAIVLVVCGMALLEGVLKAKAELVFAPLGLVTYLIAGTIGIVAESYIISGREPLYALIVIYVVLAFLAQALFGVSLLVSQLLPAWIGWSTVVWNLGLLALLLAISPADVYYPGAHHVMTLLIGLALLFGKDAAGGLGT